MTNNPDKLKQLESYGVNISQRLALEIQANQYDRKYLKTKKEKMGHILELRKLAEC